MRFADLLTYADIDHLKRMALHYGCGEDEHSKNELITSLLYYLGGSARLKEELDALTSAEFRFLQQICLDSRRVFSKEELLGKGRACLGEGEESPRDLVITGLRKGWLFPVVAGKNKALLEVPEDLRHRFLQLFAKMYSDQEKEVTPTAYRSEEGLMEEDLHRFLQFLSRQDVRLTADGAIYRHQQRQLMKSLHIAEEAVSRKGWRFGFGRRYHQYPDRFSLLYDYAYYRGYIVEDEWEGIVHLSESGVEKIRNYRLEEGKEIYRFWLRLYRHPIPQLAVIVKWIDLLSHRRWIATHTVKKVVENWLNSFYYAGEDELFQQLIRMMMHLGMLQIGETESKRKLIKMTSRGHAWVNGISGFTERTLDREYLEVSVQK
ncbi:hypothetical protein [Melghirimyces algeriensis]|uniref:Uncharacterized protein n=1 Tax=Melghirimyces algeriensis TaxID=910412 RepID=A0A521B6Z1_9BACL|nr:hypothetical protein [Melghirimyces algeriensis]SMO42859.1 hypothetical protein SAMN06264849_101586 [Melghirimyces algeriensis]